MHCWQAALWSRDVPLLRSRWLGWTMGKLDDDDTPVWKWLYADLGRLQPVVGASSVACLCLCLVW